MREITAEEIEPKVIGKEISPDEIEQPQQAPKKGGFSRGIEIGARNIAEGTAGPFLAIGDALNTGVNLVTGSINKATGTNIPELPPASVAFRQVLNEMGLPEPSSPGERIVSDIQKYGAGALSFAGPGGATQTTQSLAYKPVNQFVSGMTSGGATGITREAGGGPVAQAGAGIVGGIAGSMLPANKAVNMVSKKLTGHKTLSRTEKSAAKVLSRAKANDPRLANVIEDNRLATAELETEIPGLQLNEAARSGDPGLISGVRKLHGSDAQTAARVEELTNTESIQRYIISKIRGKGDPNAFLKKVNQAKEEISTAKVTAEKNVLSRVAEAEPARAIDVIGGEIREGILTKKTASSNMMTKMWNKIDQKAEIGAMPIVDEIKDIFGSIENYYSRLSEIPMRVMSRASAGLKQEAFEIGDDGIMTIKQVAAFNKQITRNARMARASGDEDLARNLYKLKDGVEQSIANAAGAGGAEAQKLKQFWSVYKKSHVPKFKQGKTSEILKRKGTGEYSITDTNVGGKYFAPGKKGIDGVNSFKTTFGNDEAALKNIKDYAVEDLVSWLRKDKSGLMNESRFNAWTAKHSYAIKGYGFDKKFNNLESALKEVGKFIKQEKDFNKSVLAKTIEMDPVDAVGAIFSGASRSKNIDQILSIIKKDKNAYEGFKAAVGDWFEKNMHNFRQTTKDGVSVYSGNKIERFVADKMPLLEKIYGHDGIAPYKHIITALKKTSMETNAAKSVGSPTYELFSGSARTLGKYAPLDTKIRLGRALFTGMTKNYEDAVNGLVIEAIYNPQKADRLYQIAMELNKSKNARSIGEAMKRIIIRQAVLQTSIEGE